MVGRIGHFVDIQTLSKNIVRSCLTKAFFYLRNVQQEGLSCIFPKVKEVKQVDPADVRKTPKTANLWILVEQVTRRLKCFKILANQMAINLLQYAYESCATLSVQLCMCSFVSLRKPICKDKIFKQEQPLKAFFQYMFCFVLHLQNTCKRANCLVKLQG